jgi:sec-independent protein translocase protein TatA
MSIGIWQLLLILVIVFALFGAGKLPRVMGDLGKGIRSLRKGLKEDESSGVETSKSIEHEDER